jgi:hypothetical protein
MRYLGLISTALIIGLLALPAVAQGQLPRPGKDAPPAQKGMQPGPGAQGPGAPKGAPPQAQQQQQPASAPPAPYTVLKISPPKPTTDASLAAFRKDLVAIAQKKDRPALAKVVLVKDFFWMKEEGNAAGKKTGIDALATALNLAAKDGSGWEMLGELASDESAAPYPDRPNTVCAPAGPEFKPEEFEKLVNDSKTDVGDWGFTASDNIEVHASAQANSPVIEKIDMIFVRVMPDTAPNASQDMMRIVTPSGKVGFVSAEAINPLGSDQICYGKDASGAWKIVGMIGGE